MNAPSEKSKSRRNVEERWEPEAAKTEGKPAQEERAERQKKEDDPFPRYLDMFKNNPEDFIRNANEIASGKPITV